MYWCKIYLRSFAPWKQFGGIVPKYSLPGRSAGGEFEGDGRKFSTAIAGVTSRINSYVMLNYRHMALAQRRVWSDISIGPSLLFGGQGVGKAEPTMTVSCSKLQDVASLIGGKSATPPSSPEVKRAALAIQIAGGNPLVPGAPDINAGATLTFTYYPERGIPASEGFQLNPSSRSAVGGTTIRLGDRGPQVMTLQKCLNARPSKLPRLVVDGIFGRKSQARVVEFQRDKGLKADGIVGAETRSAVGNGDLDCAEVPLQATLEVECKLTGDGFPALELFIDDQYGHQVLLGGHAPESKDQLLRLMNRGHSGGFGCLFESSVRITLNRSSLFESVSGTYEGSAVTSWPRSVIQWNQSMMSALPFPSDA